MGAPKLAKRILRIVKGDEKEIIHEIKQEVKISKELKNKLNKINLELSQSKEKLKQYQQSVNKKQPNQDYLDFADVSYKKAIEEIETAKFFFNALEDKVKHNIKKLEEIKNIAKNYAQENEEYLLLINIEKIDSIILQNAEANKNKLMILVNKIIEIEKDIKEMSNEEREFNPKYINHIEESINLIHSALKWADELSELINKIRIQIKQLKIKDKELKEEIIKKANKLGETPEHNFSSNK